MFDKVNFPHYEDTTGNRGKSIYPQLPIELVDEEAARLVREFSNPAFKGWYCKVIYTLGFEKVHELSGRAKEGGQPGKLFSKLAKEAMAVKLLNGNGGHSHE